MPALRPGGTAYGGSRHDLQRDSLVGTTANDEVGYGGVTALSNGNYVVRSRYWHNGAVANAGAATWGNGAAGVSGTISAPTASLAPRPVTT